MFKNVIAPVQAWLLSRGQCVGCGMSLDQAKKVKINSEKDKITCKCGRIFIFDTKLKKYRRALFEEI
jgi:predicted  nucleic acid-binding Zn-ribbon protein